MVGKTAALDPRARVAAVLGAALAVSSTSCAGPFAAYIPLVLLLAILSEAGWRAIAARMVPGVPFVLLAAATFSVSMGWRAGLLVALRGGLLLGLLAVLAATIDTVSLVRTISRLGTPPAVGIVAVLMARYVELLRDEWRRMARARASRGPVPVSGTLHFRIHGAQIGALLVRGWERAERIHGAMQARGFTGSLPPTPGARLRVLDGCFVLAVVALFAGARWLL
jgi:cobalt/nickel transport system permease protein